MTSCSNYRNDPGFPGCCDACHFFHDEHGAPLDESPDDPSGAPVCCTVALWLRERKKLPIN
jgi:hypothetical protein